jgi:hypothetical protein
VADLALHILADENNHHAKETVMNSIRFHSRVGPFLIAVALLLQLSPAVATGQPPAHQGTIQGSRPVEVTFTKWRTAVVVPPPPEVGTRLLFAGIAGGDLGEGEFVGEVFDRKVSTPCTFTLPSCTAGVTPPTITASIASLHAIYEVQAGERSFIALIQGGSNSAGGRLEGVIVTGWRSGAHVRVAFDTVSSCTDRDGVAHGPCFAGTIRIARAPEE